jgi:hypothetical protein
LFGTTAFKKSLSLSALRLRIDERDQIAKCLFDSSQLFSTLSLDLSFTALDNVFGLCNMLRSNMWLLKLGLSGLKVKEPNGIGKVFSTLLESKVESLIISFLNMRDDDLLSLSHYLKRTTNLTALDFGLPISQEKEAQENMILMTV